MTSDLPDWLESGSGEVPRVGWTFSTEAPLVGLQTARETGETLVADESGGLYLLDRTGKIAALARGPSPIRGIAWSDTGGGGIALVGDETLYWFDRELKFDKKVVVSEPVQTIALDAHGQYAAAGLSDGTNLIFDGPRKPIRRFDTNQSLVRLEFLVREPAIIGVAEFGMLYKFTFEGQEVWREDLLSNVGDMCITGNGQSILLACFVHGIQRHDVEGQNVGSYQLGSTTSLISSSFGPYRMMAATVEKELFWMDFDGRVIWKGKTPQEVRSLVCDPLGTGGVCGFPSGQIVHLVWG